MADNENTGYRESDDHVPDPTALTGTLETSGTGGGVHERLTGTTQVFGNAEDTLRRAEALIAERTAALAEEVRGMLLQQHETTLPQQTTEDQGLPGHHGSVVDPEDRSGVAQVSEPSAEVAAEEEDDKKSDSNSEYVEKVSEHFSQALKGRPVSEAPEETEEESKTPPAKKTAAATRRNTKK